MIRWIAYINHERSTAEEQLGELKWAAGYRDAQEDFDAGQRRIYSLKVVPYPAIGQPVNNLTKEFIGRTNGSLEIWTWPCYQGDEVDLRVVQGQIGGYNMHMKCLCRYYGKPRLQAAANANIDLTTAFPHTVLNAESK